jgi:hypothetical protein
MKEGLTQRIAVTVGGLVGVMLIGFFGPGVEPYELPWYLLAPLILLYLVTCWGLWRCLKVLFGRRAPPPAS